MTRRLQHRRRGPFLFVPASAPEQAADLAEHGLKPRQ